MPTTEAPTPDVPVTIRCQTARTYSVGMALTKGGRPSCAARSTFALSSNGPDGMAAMLACDEHLARVARHLLGMMPANDLTVVDLPAVG